jgi:uncharacterized surface protein with fasciclin (FAS1) repeats
MIKYTIWFSFLMALLLVPLTPTAQAQNATALDIAASDPTFSTLVAAVNAADPAVAQTLGAPGSLTVFAPTNAAFEDLFATLGVTPEQVLADTALLTDILLYHVAQPASFSGELARLDGRAIGTLLSSNALAVSSPGPGSIRLNNRVNVVQADITASNGVVHVIDRVLLPNRVFLGVGTNTSQPPPQPAATRTPVPAAPSTAGRGALGVAHLAPTAPAVDVYVNGEVAVPGLTFGNITDFIPLAPGSYDVAIAPAGTSLQDAVFGPATVNVGNGQFLTTAAVGSLDAGTFNVFVFPNDLSSANGQARIGVLHAIEDAPAVQVYVNGQALIRPIAFAGQANAVGDAFVSLDITATTYPNLTVAPAGVPSRTVLDLSGTTFDPGVYYLVAAIGSLANPDVLVVTAQLPD